MCFVVEIGEVDVLFQRVVNKGCKVSNMNSLLIEFNFLDVDFDDGGLSVVEQIIKVEDIFKKLNLIKRECI